MNRYDRFFRATGILIVYLILTVLSVTLIQHDFPIKDVYNQMLNYAFLNIGALGLWIFYKWIKE